MTKCDDWLASPPMDEVIGTCEVCFAEVWGSEYSRRFDGFLFCEECTEEEERFLDLKLGDYFTKDLVEELARRTGVISNEVGAGDSVNIVDERGYALVRAEGPARVLIYSGGDAADD